MANPFVAGADGDPTAGLPDANSFADIQNQWNDFLAKPGGQAALMQFAVNLAQPPSFGDTAISRLGRAVGGAGEAVGRVEAQDIAQQEAQSKEALRSTTGELQTERAAHLGDVQAGRKEAAQQALTIKQLSTKFQLRKLYETEKQKFEGDIVNRPPAGTPGHEFQSYSEWLVNDPQAQALAADAGINVDLSKPPTSTAPAAVPDAPPNPADRKPNTTYNTPKGPLKWTGTGWISP